MKDKCYQGGKQHNFQPRYSEQERNNKFTEIVYPNLEELRRFTTLKIYKGDICIWCGKINGKEIDKE